MGTLYRALHAKNIHDFTTWNHLETFLKKRPHLFHFPSAKPKKNMGKIIKTKVNLDITSEIETASNDPDGLTTLEYLEAFTGIIENNFNNANNSSRITLDDDRKAIMFKTEWLFHEMGIQKSDTHAKVFNDNSKYYLACLLKVASFRFSARICGRRFTRAW